MTSHHNLPRRITLHHIASHHIKSLQITSHCIASHYITSHYITSHHTYCITLLHIYIYIIIYILIYFNAFIYLHKLYTSLQNDNDKTEQSAAWPQTNPSKDSDSEISRTHPLTSSELKPLFSNCQRGVAPQTHSALSSVLRYLHFYCFCRFYTISFHSEIIVFACNNPIMLNFRFCIQRRPTVPTRIDNDCW